MIYTTFYQSKYKQFNSSNGYYHFSDSPISIITIGDSVQRIPAYFAYNLDSLSAITVPNSITSIPSSAFEGCSSLTTLNFNAVNCSDFSYSNHPFIDCPISTIVIGNSVQKIPAYFAHNKSSLTSVTISNSVTSIRESAFYNCSGLTSVSIPNSVTSIENYAFSGCSSLDTIIIPNSITTLGEGMFQNCSNLAYAVIGKNISSIGNKAFYGCNNLHNVTSLASFPPTLGSEVFSATAILKVPCGSAAYYSAPAAKWGEYFISIEEVCDNITITVISANENMGTVSGSGEYLFGSEVTITATPKQGYRFVSWNDGNTENPRTIVVEAEVTYIATFEEEIGIETANELDELRLYPNPTKGFLNFNMEVEKVEVMDMMGKMVMQFYNASEINIGTLPKGVYCLKLSYSDKAIIHKIIKE